MDPTEVQSRFAAVEPLLFEEHEEDRLSIEDFEPFFKKLPSREIDLIDMYFKKCKKQKEIAEYFNVSQGAISHRLSRAMKRLRLLRDQPKIDGNLKQDLRELFTDFEIELISLMINTTCQSKTAKLLNDRYALTGKDIMTQVKVRHKFERSISKLEKNSPERPVYKQYHSLCVFIKNNLYMLHEVKLPHFDKGFRAEYAAA
jgi:predicted DNA-binding protein YlxM (UPF0122 family)